MASSKAFKLKRKLTVQSKAWLADVLTITFTGNHLLATGDTIKFVDPHGSVNYDVAVTNTGATTITIPALDRNIRLPVDIFVESFPTGFSGNSEVATLSYANFVAQATVTTSSGNAAAVAAFQVSNDLIGWFPAETYTLASGASPVTDGAAIKDAWTYCRLNVTSVTGTGGKLICTVSGVN